MADPDPLRAVEKYRRHAARFDATAHHTMTARYQAVELLQLRPGESVLDVACGTGLALPLLHAAIGPRGRVVGVEVSPEMIARARERVARAGWKNVALIEASMEDVATAERFDAVLFTYTHDVLQSEHALRNIFSLVRPGARVALAGIKHPPAWLFPLRWYGWFKARPYVTTFEGMERPWGKLTRYVPDLRVRELTLGTGYLGYGRVHPSIGHLLPESA